MELKTTTTHKITFSVQYFEATEGGMDSEQYGKDVDNLKEAVNLLLLANVARPDCNWMVVGNVQTIVS
jgi:hypothetical protein